MTSLRSIIACNGPVPTRLSVLEHLFGHVTRSPTDPMVLQPAFPVVVKSDSGASIGIGSHVPVGLSVRRQFELASGARFNMVLRPVSAAQHDIESWRRMNAALYVARGLYASAEIGIGRVYWMPIPDPAASSHYDLELNGFGPLPSMEMAELVDDYAVTDVHGITVFLVGTITRDGEARAGTSGGARACPPPDGIGEFLECATAAGAGAAIGAVVVGILGAILGGLVAGPPGAAAGAATGATIGGRLGAGLGIGYCVWNIHGAAVAIQAPSPSWGDGLRGWALAHEVGHYLGFAFSPGTFSTHKPPGLDLMAEFVPPIQMVWDGNTGLPVVQFPEEYRAVFTGSSCARQGGCD
ncbi:MAG: hypothetical protein ACOYOB_17815 [Myxococcota bacterium]